MHAVCIASGLNQSVSFSIPVLFRRTTKNSSRIFSPRPKSQGYSRHLRAKRRYRDSLRVGGCDPPRHHFIVHDANPAWGIAESDDRRLQSTGIHLGHSRNEFYKSRVLPINTGVADEIDRYLCARKERKQPALQIRHSSGTLRGVAERIAARACATPSNPCFRSAVSSLPKESCHGFRTFGTVLP